MTYLQDAPRSKTTLPKLQAMRFSKEKIAALTCYDASFAALMDIAGIDAIIVGDSLGNVLHGHGTTICVTIENIAYHTSSVARGNSASLLIADIPFGHLGSREQAYSAAVRLMQAGAHVVKIEGGEWLEDTIRFLVERSIPVCAHIGLTPQSVHSLGGFRVQGRSDTSAKQLLKDALAVQQAGAQIVVIEAVPAALADEITQELHIPTIGIGAGAACSGQVLVMHDMLGIYTSKRPRFVRDFLRNGLTIQEAVVAYVKAVKDESFPAAEHCF